MGLRYFTLLVGGTYLYLGASWYYVVTYLPTLLSHFWMRDEGVVVMEFKHYVNTYFMLSEDGGNGMGCGTAAYKKTSRRGGME